MAKEKTITIHGLMKIGQEKYIDELQKEGKLFCNTVKYFREVETEDKNRRDSREGAFKTQLADPESLALSIDGKKLPVNFTYARFNQFDKRINHYKLFCMYGINNKHITGVPFIDKKNIDFGDKSLIITNTEEFMECIDNELKTLDLEYSCDYVTYYKEESKNDQLSVFHKLQEFAYQSEFRFFIKDQNPEPLVFKIGSIENISMVIDSNKLPKLSLKPE